MLKAIFGLIDVLSRHGDRDPVATFAMASSAALAAAVAFPLADNPPLCAAAMAAVIAPGALIGYRRLERRDRARRGGASKRSEP